MWGMFSHFSASSLDYISGWDVSNVQYMNEMFKNAYLDCGLDLSGWDVSNVLSMPLMFSMDNGVCGGDGRIGYLNLSGWAPLSCSNFDDMFAGFVTSHDVIIDGWTLGSAESSSLYAMFWWFQVGEGATFSISDWVVGPSVTDMSRMFYEFYVMDDLVRTIDISGWNPSPDCDTSDMFYDCDLVVIGKDKFVNEEELDE
jgi:surface protein